MSERIYSFSCKMGIELASLDIYENKLIIKNDSLNHVIDFNQIKSLSFDEDNNKELQIISDNSKLSINILETNTSSFVNAYNYINDRITQTSFIGRNMTDYGQSTYSSNIFMICLRNPVFT